MYVGIRLGSYGPGYLISPTFKPRHTGVQDRLGPWGACRGCESHSAVICDRCPKAYSVSGTAESAAGPNLMPSHI